MINVSANCSDHITVQHIQCSHTIQTNFAPDNEAKITRLLTQLVSVTARLTTVNACYQQNNKN